MLKDQIMFRRSPAFFVDIAQGQKKDCHNEGSFGDNSLEPLAQCGKLIINHARGKFSLG